MKASFMDAEVNGEVAFFFAKKAPKFKLEPHSLAMSLVELRDFANCWPFCLPWAFKR
jgi:hypothetical protein